MKEYIANAKEALAVVREGLIIVVILAVIGWPDRVGGWLARHGLKQIEYAGAVIPLDQFNQTRETLNTVAVAAAQSERPEVKSTLEAVASQLQATLVQQVRSIATKDPGALPQAGWVYLGTIGVDQAGWRSEVTPNVRSAWPLHADDTAVVATDVNLRADSSPETRPRARILSVLPKGTVVRIKQLDTSRPVPAGDPAAPGFRVWAQVELVAT